MLQSDWSESEFILTAAQTLVLSIKQITGLYQCGCNCFYSKTWPPQIDAVKNDL